MPSLSPRFRGSRRITLALLRSHLAHGERAFLYLPLNLVELRLSLLSRTFSSSSH
jgi:hypothetical protein